MSALGVFTRVYSRVNQLHSTHISLGVGKGLGQSGGGAGLLLLHGKKECEGICPRDEKVRCEPLVATFLGWHLVVTTGAARVRLQRELPSQCGNQFIHA
jgi:hypothetical protein